MENKDNNRGGNPQGEERRKFPRAKIPCMVRYKRCGFPDETYEVSRTKDISAGGLRFTSHKKFEPGTDLDFKILLPPKSIQITVVGKIAWAEEAKLDVLYENGVKFVKISARDRNLISKLVANSLK